jgi:hypothetical protein
MVRRRNLVSVYNPNVTKPMGQERHTQNSQRDHGKEKIMIGENTCKGGGRGVEVVLAQFMV